jgi:3-phosphoglycerate kinase
MTKAEKMREITNKALEQKRVESVARHHNYVDRIVNRKVNFAANLCKSSVVAKIKPKYSTAIIVEELTRYGFEVKQASKNGRAILTIKW